MPRFYISLLFVFFLPVWMICHSSPSLLDVFTRDKSIKLSLLLMDTNYQNITLGNKSDFQIFDNGYPITNFNFSSGDSISFEKASVILLYDLSIGNLPNTSQNKTIAKNLITHFVSSNNDFEFALISFNTNSYLLSNFTTKTSNLIDLLFKLDIQLGSSFDSAFFAYKTGAFEVAQFTQNQVSIVLITDKNRISDYQKILSKAREKNIKIFILMVNNQISNELKEISRNSDGMFFQNLTLSDTNKISTVLKFLILGGQPNVLTWEILPLCNTIHSETIIFQRIDTLRFETSFAISDFPELSAIPPFLRFSSVKLGNSKDLDLNLVAKNYDIKIDSVKLANPHFSIISGNIVTPIILKKDEVHKITIRFTPTDSSIVFDSLVIYSEACKVKKVNITGGFPNKRPKVKTLQLISPNCGEIFAIGDTVQITWEGLLPADVVQLQYSTDNGQSWDTLAVNVLGLKYNFWLNPIKFSETDSMLIRIIQIWPNNAGETIELLHQGPVNIANFNRDASLIITGSNHPNEFATIWNPGTGRKVFSLNGHTKQVNWAVFDNTDKYALTSSDDSTSILWSIESGEPVAKFTGHRSRVTSANFSPDGNYIVTSGTDGACFIWDVQKRRIVDTLSLGQNPIYFASFSPDSNNVLFASYDGNIYAWNIKQRKITKTFKTNKSNNHIHHFSISLEKNKIASASHLGLINIWNYDTTSSTATLNPLYELAHDTISFPAINNANFNSTGSWLITSGSDARILRWNPETGELIDSIAIAEHFNSVTSASFSFDDAMLLTSSWDSTVKIFNRTKLGLQIDTSDCPFSITKTSFLANDIEFGLVPILQTKDTLVYPLGVNKSKIPLHLKSITLFGPNFDDFKLIDYGSTNIIQSGDSIFAYFSFTPTDIGVRSAFLKLDYDGDSTIIQLSGIGFQEPLYKPISIVDMGKVELGLYKDTVLTVALKNISEAPIEILTINNLGPDSLNFTIINGQQPITLLPQQTLPLTIRFTPDTIGRKNTIIQFITNSQIQRYYIQFFAEGVPSVFDSLTLSIGEFEGVPGEIIQVPIKIESRLFQYYNSNYEGIAFDLTFNKTLLEPLFPFISSTFSNNHRTLHIETKSDIKNDLNLIVLDFRVGLGNDSITSLIINNSYPLGSGKIVINEKSGIFRLKNICREGGPRLFESDGRFWLSNPNPNPVSNIAIIEFEIIENGLTTLNLYNFDGWLIKTLLSSDLKAGKYSITFSVDDLSEGIFFLILKAPNSTTIKSFQVIK
ncbi:MAG: choice-of-anchor D domain-containing protein [Candidatus Kapaibacteriales bacterium]